MTDTSIDLAGHEMVAMSRAALAALRAALMRDTDHQAAAYLREAGYAGGETVWASFVSWLAKTDSPDPADMTLEELESRASAYFRETGWGSLAISSLGGAVASVDSEDWGEADPASALDGPGCHFTTGMLADFFGRMGEEPLAVLEVECRSAGASRCRFLLGNAEVMTYVYEEMDGGTSYEAALALVE